MKTKTIGILGGMGPAAGAVTFQKLITLAQSKYGATQDSDYPPMLLYNMIVEGFGEDGSLETKGIEDQLIAGVKKLEEFGSDFIIIACNTVHYFFDSMQSAIDVPIVSIIDTAVEAVQNSGFKKVGVVCSEGTNKVKLYENALQENKITPTMPNSIQQQDLNNIILSVMNGSQGKAEKVKILNIFEEYKNEQVEGIILGCTELPLAISQSDTSIKLFDTIELICLKALKIAYGD